MSPSPPLPASSIPNGFLNCLNHSPSFSSSMPTPSRPRQFKVFLPSSLHAEEHFSQTSPMLPSPQSSIQSSEGGGGTVVTATTAKCPSQSSRAKIQRQQPFVISITSPTPPNSLEFRHFGTAPECHQSPTKDATTVVGRPCWKKLLLTIGVLLFLAILGAISFVNFSLWTRLDTLERHQAMDHLWINNLMRLDGIVKEKGKMLDKFAEKFREMEAKIDEMEENQRKIENLMRQKSKDTVSSGSTTSSSTASSPKSAGATSGHGDFVVYLNGKPISGNEFLAKSQYEMELMP